MVKWLKLTKQDIDLRDAACIGRRYLLYFSKQALLLVYYENAAVVALHSLQSW